MAACEQKCAERVILKSFLGQQGIRGQVTSQERPDFLVDSADGPLGVELTQYHCTTSEGGSPERRLTHEMSNVLCHLRKIARRPEYAHLHGLDVILGPQSGDGPHRRDREPLALEVIKYVSTCADAVRTTGHMREQRPFVDEGGEGDYKLMDKYLRYISIGPVGHDTFTATICLTGFVSVNIASLQQCIGKKINMYRRLAPHAKRLWLLVYAQGDVNSACLPSPDVVKDVLESREGAELRRLVRSGDGHRGERGNPFERVFLYDFARGIAYGL